MYIRPILFCICILLLALPAAAQANGSGHSTTVTQNTADVTTGSQADNETVPLSVSDNQTDEDLDEPGFDDEDDEMFGFDDEDEVDDFVVIAIPDPIQGYNRAIHGFNDGMYIYALRPTSKGWEFILPSAPRRCLQKFFLNLGMPVRFISCLLQAKIVGAGSELSRFVINTTIGIAGFFDPAKAFGLPAYPEDFGQAFAVWGMGPGFYFVLPVYGPSSGRDALGKIFDLALNPVTYIPGATILEYVNTTSFVYRDIDDLRAAAIDPYSALRNAYMQLRTQAIKK